MQWEVVQSSQSVPYGYGLASLPALLRTFLTLSKASRRALSVDQRQRKTVMTRAASFDAGWVGALQNDCSPITVNEFPRPRLNEGLALMLVGLLANSRKALPSTTLYQDVPTSCYFYEPDVRILQTLPCADLRNIVAFILWRFPQTCLIDVLETLLWCETKPELVIFSTVTNFNYSIRWEGFPSGWNAVVGSDLDGSQFSEWQNFDRLLCFACQLIRFGSRPSSPDLLLHKVPTERRGQFYSCESRILQGHHNPANAKPSFPSLHFSPVERLPSLLPYFPPLGSTIRCAVAEPFSAEGLGTLQKSKLDFLMWAFPAAEQSGLFARLRSAKTVTGACRLVLQDEPELLRNSVRLRTDVRMKAAAPMAENLQQKFQQLEELDAIGLDSDLWKTDVEEVLLRGLVNAQNGRTANSDWYEIIRSDMLKWLLNQLQQKLPHVPGFVIGDIVNTQQKHVRGQMPPISPSWLHVESERLCDALRHFTELTVDVAKHSVAALRQLVVDSIEHGLEDPSPAELWLCTAVEELHTLYLEQLKLVRKPREDVSSVPDLNTESKFLPLVKSHNGQAHSDLPALQRSKAVSIAREQTTASNILLRLYHANRIAAASTGDRLAASRFACEARSLSRSLRRLKQETAAQIFTMHNNNMAAASPEWQLARRNESKHCVNAQQFTKVDLHGQSSAEAVVLLDRQLRQLRQLAEKLTHAGLLIYPRNCPWCLAHVITGRGLHSKHGVSTLAVAVQHYLESQHMFQWRFGYPGAFIVAVFTRPR